MQELVDKQAALKKMCESCGRCERFEKAMQTTHPNFVTYKCSNYRLLSEQPTIEPKRGRWKKVSEKSPKYVCTNCNHLFNNRSYKFCPHCGAKMDGGADNA